MNDIILKFSQQYKSVCTFADPAMPSSIVDMRALGRSSGDVGMAQTVSGYNPVISGINQCQALFEHGRLFIVDDHEKRIGNLNPREILDQLASYCWKTDRDGTVIEGKISEGCLDHFADALRYSLAREKPYSLLQTGQTFGDLD